MSVSTEVQRTLVKSPPELWAELGDVDGLARHLGEIGEIRVVKVEPETRVEWEADLASGFVELKQSGWGTKVTLSLTRELPEAERDAEAEAETDPEAVPAFEAADGERGATAEPEAAAGPDAEAEPVAAEPEVANEQVAAAPASEPEPAGKPQPDPVAAEPEPERTATEPEPKPETQPAATEPLPKQGFLARLFKRRQPTPVVTEPEPEPAVQPQAMALPEPIYPDPLPKPVEPEPSADLTAELAQLEAQLQQQSTEFLTGVLDRLGAAHHRPFSRA